MSDAIAQRSVPPVRGVVGDNFVAAIGVATDAAGTGVGGAGVATTADLVVGCTGGACVAAGAGGAAGTSRQAASNVSAAPEANQPTNVLRLSLRLLGATRAGRSGMSLDGLSDIVGSFSARRDECIRVASGGSLSRSGLRQDAGRSVAQIGDTAPCCL